MATASDLLRINLASSLMPAGITAMKPGDHAVIVADDVECPVVCSAKHATIEDKVEVVFAVLHEDGRAGHDVFSAIVPPGT